MSAIQEGIKPMIYPQLPKTTQSRPIPRLLLYLQQQQTQALNHLISLSGVFQVADSIDDTCIGNLGPEYWQWLQPLRYSVTQGSSRPSVPRGLGAQRGVGLAAVVPLLRQPDLQQKQRQNYKDYSFIGHNRSPYMHYKG